MNAGKYRFRVAVEVETKAKSAAGKLSSSWDAAGYAWCSIDELEEETRYTLAQADVLATHKVEGRYTALIVAGVRLNWDGRYLYVKRVRNPHNRNIKLEILAWEDK